MPTPKSVSAIIVSYNDLGYLKNCVRSVSRSLSGLDCWEIVIVNNDERQKNSFPGLDFPKVRVIDHGENVGFGAGINIGAKAARGEFLFIFNSDAKIASENLIQALDQISEGKEVGIVGGGIFNGAGEPQKWSAGKEISFHDLAMNNLGLSRSKKIWSSNNETFCDWVSGTALLIRKDFFDSLNGFDERFFMYFEDMDLCRRARMIGKKVLFFPKLKIIHGSGQSYSNKDLQKKHYYDSMEKYLKKHSKWPSFLAFKAYRELFLKN